MTAATAPAQEVEGAPARAGLVLVALVLGASLANVNLGVANVALPDIDRSLDASQTGLNLIAVGYSLGLAGSVLWLGALGDRHGRKMMLLLGLALSVPAAALAAWAPSVTVLALARVVGGVAAGMAYPTTLALITALWTGVPRTKAIALWSAFGGAASALGPLAAGAVLTMAWWGAAFLLSIPIAVVAAALTWRVVPPHVHESTDPVDNLGGILSVVLVGSLVLAINFAPMPGQLQLAAILAAVAIVSLVSFVRVQRRSHHPLYDLHIAGRTTFWVAAVAGIIVFGSLMGAMFVGQQYLQNVLGYSSLASGAAILPAAAAMLVVAPRSARLVEARGSRFTLLVGYAFCIAGFLAMLVFWQRTATVWSVVLAFVCIGAGVGFAGTPASRSLTGSVPVERVGMASGTADLQRDFGGAVMQSILGALLTAGYATAIATAVAAQSPTTTVNDEVAAQLQRSYASAESVAEQFPAYSDQIMEAARTAFVQGQQWAYTAGLAAVVVGAALVAWRFPAHRRELELRSEYAREDAGHT